MQKVSEEKEERAKPVPVGPTTSLRLPSTCKTSENNLASKDDQNNTIMMMMMMMVYMLAKRAWS